MNKRGVTKKGGTLMRQIPTSGGIELGPREGPWIDVIPLQGTPVDLEDVTRAIVTGELAWEHWPPGSLGKAGNALLRTPVTKGTRGVVGYNDVFALRFLYLARMEPVAALRTILHHETHIPPAIMAALTVTVRRTIHPGRLAESLISSLVNSAVIPAFPSPPLSRRELEGLANRFLQALGETHGNAEIPADPIDRARLYLEIGRLLWSPEALQLLAQRALSPETAMLARLLAGCTIDLSARDTLLYAGRNLTLPKRADSYPLIWWPQMVELYRAACPLEALIFLGGLPAGPRADESAVFATPTRYIPPVNHLMRGLIQALREEIAAGEFLPYGEFVLELPANYPLRTHYAITHLRIWARGNDCAYIALYAEGRNLAICAWQPGEPLSDWVVSPAAQQLVDLTLTALWRDLSVVGDTATPAPARPPTRSLTSASTAPRRTTAARTFPRRRCQITGNRTWGDTADHERITRDTHQVRGHPRRLPEGWQTSPEARETARAYGLTLPAGYSFVRPHWRGGDAEAKPAADTVVTEPQPIRVRGLASVMLLLEAAPKE